ncbi:MAG: protein kinase [Myxococcales bacterium]|nr:protein kinase [Myxococcales bacterium]
MAALAAGEVVAGAEHRYRLERELGRGGFGVTWLAHREADGQAVVLKQLHISRVQDAKSLELFRREIQVLRRLDHPRIPRWLDDFEAEGHVLVQTFVAGHDLDRVVRGDASMDEAGLVAWLAQMLDVLDYLHHLTPPVIHRDVTPKNILIGPDGGAWLVDFGAVKVGLGGTMASTTAGTFGYAPMEQFVGKAFPQTDLYGLGMTAVAVASGKRPEDMPFAGLRVDVRAITRLDARLTRLLERLTEPDPERRLADARVALEQLRPLLGRYDGDRGASAGALDRLAAAQRRAPSGRAAVAADDLLPSERIREAGVRLAELGEGALGIPDLDALVTSFESGGLSPDGSLAALGPALVDLDRLEVVGRLPGNLSVVALASAGAFVAARGDTHARDVVIHARTGGGFEQRAHVVTDVTEHCALSPDGRTLAIIKGFFSDKEGEALVFDVASGQQVQRLPGGEKAWIGFSPDGQTLAVLDDDRRLQLLRQAGGEQVLRDVVAFGFSTDGRTGAVIADGKLHIGPVEALPRGPGVRTFKISSATWRLPTFSADGRWLALLDYSDDRLCVLEVATGREVLRVGAPGRPAEVIRGVQALAFSPDGTRLAACCDSYFNRFSGEDEDCIALWSVPDGRYLGALLRAEKGKKIMAVAAEGFFGQLEGDKPGKDAAGGWHQPAAARAALRGLPMEEHLDATSRAALADLETRWAYFVDQQRARAIDEAAALQPLVDATRGLTHVLDAVLREARRAQAAMPAFGGTPTAATPLSADQVVAAARALARKPAAELERLHLALVSEAEAAEAEAARAVAPPPRTASWPAAPRSVAPPPEAAATPAAAPADPDRARRVRAFVIAAGVAIAVALAALAALL